MLRDTLRSAVHASLMKPAPVNGRRTGRPRSSMGEEEKRSSEESGGKSHLQLFQASEGARELARMIDSLSKAPSLDGRSKDIARDLLRGARDLQSSLAMLAELQEEPRRDARRPGAKERREEVGMQRTARPNRLALQEEVDGSARSFRGERRRMPSGRRPEFLKQEMGVGETMVSERVGSRKSRFSVGGSGLEERKATVSRLKFKQRFEYTEEGIGVGMQKPRPSGRSSGEPERMSRFKLRQRSECAEEAFCAEGTMRSKRFGPPEPRLSVDSIEELRRVIKDGLCRQEEELSGPSPAIFQPKQAKGPNVIAKLMGLDEEVPSEDERRKKKKKSLIMPRPAFDIDDRPKARKMQAAETPPDPTQKSLHEIIAALQFKGLLRSGRGFDASQFEMFSRSFNKEEGEVPPIVIMRPLCLPHWEGGEMKSAEETGGGASQMANALTTVAQKLQRKKGSESSRKTCEGQKLLLEKDDEKKKILQIKPETKNSTSVAKKKKKTTSSSSLSAAKSIRKSADTKTEDEHWEEGKRNLQEGKDLFSKSSTLEVHDLSGGAYKQAKPYIQDGKQENLCQTMRKSTATRVASEVEEDLMCLLLSSRSFISHAKELFLIDAHHQPVHHKRRGIGEDVMRNAKLYLDCGKELMARKSSQIVKKRSLCSSSAFPSLAQLAEEISGVIETLVESYSQIDYNVTSEDKLRLRLERDLRGNDRTVASANWDIGWADWVCTEEAGRVVGALEEFIFGWLLTEVAQDLVWM